LACDARSARQRWYQPLVKLSAYFRFCTILQNHKRYVNIVRLAKGLVYAHKSPGDRVSLTLI